MRKKIKDEWEIDFYVRVNLVKYYSTTTSNFIKEYTFKEIKDARLFREALVLHASGLDLSHEEAALLTHEILNGFVCDYSPIIEREIKRLEFEVE